METAAAFDNHETFQERRRMVVGTRHRAPTEDEGYQRLVARMERLQNERERALVLYPIALAVVVNEPDEAAPAVALVPDRRRRIPGVPTIGRLWVAGVRWLKHPVAQWDV